MATPSHISLPALLNNNTNNGNVLADDMVKQLIKPSNCTRYVYADCKSITWQIYTDKSRPVLIPSASGMEYAMVLHDFDSNLIWDTAIPSKTKLQLVTDYKSIFLLM